MIEQYNCIWVIMLRNFLNYLRVIPVIATYYTIDRHVISISNADGVSMQPSIHSGDIVIIDRFLFKLLPLSKDDVVVATQPVNPQVSICKRISAVGGSQLPLAPPIIVPEMHYWL